MKFGFKNLKLCILISLIIFNYSCSTNKLPDQNSNKQPTSKFGKKVKIDIVRFNDKGAYELEQNTVDALKESGFENGIDYELRSRSAQSDISTLTMLIDASVTDNTDLLITFHSQSLYSALKRAPNKNILFALTSNPFILGAGKSDTEHLDNVSGIYYVPASDLIIDSISKCKPRIDKLGIIFKTGDIESVFQKQLISEAAQSKKIEIIESGFTTETEISEAVMSLINKRVNGMFQIYDTFNEISLPVLSKKCGDSKIPLFGYGHADRLEMGMTMTAERPYKDMGKIFAEMIIKILKGEKPGNLPFLSNELFNSSLFINLDSASASGLIIPENIIKTAEKVITKK